MDDDLARITEGEMTGEEWRAVKAIVADALALPESERDACVANRCGSDDALARDVRSLLASTARATHLFETPFLTTAGLTAVLAEADAAVAPFVGRTIGAYRLSARSDAGEWAPCILAERATTAFRSLSRSS